MKMNTSATSLRKLSALFVLSVGCSTSQTSDGGNPSSETGGTSSAGANGSGSASSAGANGSGGTASAGATGSGGTSNAGAGSMDEVCKPNLPACDGDRAVVCNAEGTGYLPGGKQCSSTQTCSKGSCEDRACSPDATFCGDKDVRQCASDGLSSKVVTTCAQGHVCAEGAGVASCEVQICTPSTSECDGDNARTCNAAGTAFVSETDCSLAGKACVGGSCTGECAPGQRRCNGKLSQECSASGAWMDDEICDFVCSGEGECGGECSPDTYRCAGEHAQLCDGSGTWTTAPLGTEDASGCVDYHLDADNDGFGVKEDSKCLCAPHGNYKVKPQDDKFDCCDTDSRAHPNQSECFGTQRIGCGGYDFNCDTQSTKCSVLDNIHPNQCAVTCTLLGWDSVFGGGCPRSCGQQGNYITKWGPGPICTAAAFTTTNQPCL